MKNVRNAVARYPCSNSEEAIDEVTKWALPQLLSSVLEGRVPIEEARKMCANMLNTDMYRWKFEIAIKLREGKPKDALELADAFKADDKYPDGFLFLVDCAHKHIKIDDWLLENGLTPPPPLTLSHEDHFIEIPLDILMNRPAKPDLTKYVSGHRVPLPKPIQKELKKFIPDHRKQYNSTELLAISIKFGVTVPQIQWYFKRRRTYFARKLKAEQHNQMKWMMGEKKPTNDGFHDVIALG
ncbi:Protein CBR-CEH-75 [Caenorhabditis briggsae]|uniref:Homeobox domain-containing protein n=2 Tax=Caenorhabditis briggsae TaxID=6238 RepID=A0AAE8ZX07_CAEBR|nr:Protein CBR-CEH-75 [Caenorhabditis briggsae]ULT88353.1 hypothetical protein L3Y34_007506 [Caenorhabditis briggsae]CAP27015.1 Protein CBR-CEH-75 [Caenorhabditis briggsae]